VTWTLQAGLSRLGVLNVAGNQLVRSSGPVDEGLSLVLPHVVLGVTPEGLFVVHSKCRRMCCVRLAHQSCCIAPAPRQRSHGSAKRGDAVKRLDQNLVRIPKVLRASISG
jgi:hypothetical protein